MVNYAISPNETTFSLDESVVPEQETFFSRDGYLVDFFCEKWLLSKDVKIPVGLVDGFLASTMSLSFKRVLSHFAKTHSANYTFGIFQHCKSYFEQTKGLDPFGLESLISYRSSLDSDTEFKISVVRGFMRQWVRLGYGGISDEVQGLLDKWTLKGTVKGRAVQSMCPDSGPLTDIEMQGVFSRLIDAHGRSEISLATTCCAMIILLTGRRPVQVSALKVKDVYSRSGKYWINFPRAKQRG